MNNTIIKLCVTLILLGNSLYISAQETSLSSPEEQPSELTMEQVCEQSADADGIVGKAREAYMANCLASLTNITPEEEDNPQDSSDNAENKTEEDKPVEEDVKSALAESKNKEPHSKPTSSHEKHAKTEAQK